MDKKMTVVELKELLDRTGGPMEFKFNPDECRPIKFTWNKIKTHKTSETYMKREDYNYDTRTWTFKEVPVIQRTKVGEEVRWVFGNEETGVPIYLSIGADKSGAWFQFDKNTKLLYVFLVVLSHTTRKNCENAKYEHSTTGEVFIVTQNHQIFKRTDYNDWRETKRIKSSYYGYCYNTIVQRNDVIYNVLSKMWGKDITSPQGTVFKTLDSKSGVYAYQILSTIETKFRENNSAKSEEYRKQFNETADKLSVNVKGEDICLDYSEKFGYFARYFMSDKHEVCRFVYNKGKKQIFVWQNNKWNKSNARGANLWYLRVDRLYITERARQSDDSINYFVNNDNRLIFEGSYEKTIVEGFMRNHKILYEIYTTMLSLNIDRVNQHILSLGPDSIDTFFGEINDKAKTLWGKLGVNKHQFMRAFDGEERRYYSSEMRYNYLYPVKLLKTALKQQDIRYIDNNIFDKLLSRSNLEIMENIGYYWHRDRFERATGKEITLDFLVKLSEHSYSYNTLADYLDMRGQLQKHSVDISEFPVLPKDSELQTLHDREVVMLENINNRDLNTKMVDAAKYASKFDFDDKESDFIITHPNTAGDVANEGLVLHHCVKSYIQRIADLKTTILFLRKRTNPDTPFYTINIERGRLVQIHGSCNCWLGCNPEAIPTVAKWLKKFKIQYDLADVLSTGTSYGGRSAKQVENIYGL